MQPQGKAVSAKEREAYGRYRSVSAVVSKGLVMRKGCEQRPQPLVVVSVFGTALHHFLFQWASSGDFFI